MGTLSGELPLTYLPLDSFLSLSLSLSIHYSLISSTSTGSIRTDCDHNDVVDSRPQNLQVLQAGPHIPLTVVKMLEEDKGDCTFMTIPPPT
jgi:hypothetical protein